MRYWLAIAISLACSPSLAQQSVRQSGHITPGHAVQWTTNGVIQDAGTAANGTLSSLGTTGLGPTICANSGYVTGPYQQTCIGSTSAGGLLSLQNYGGAPSGSLAVTVNGTSLLSLGSTGVNFTAPIMFNGALPGGSSAQALCETSAGVLSFGCAGGGGSGVSSLNSLTGALNITAGSNITVTPSGSSIQISASGSGGSGTVNSGTQYQLGYYATTGTTISGLSSAAYGFLITNASGVPSWGTQSGLTTASSLTSATVPVFISTGAIQQATLGTLVSGTGISITGTTTVTIGLNGTISGSSGIFATASGTLTNGHCVSINNGSFIDAGGACTTGGGGGTVSSGLSNQLAYYASNGTIVGGLATCASGVYGTTAGSVPQCETTLPAGLTIGNLTLSGTLTAASLSTSGTVAGALCQTSAGLVLYEAGVDCYPSSLVVGSSSVSGGTNNYFLTTGSGTLANVAPTGTGNVVLASAPSVDSPTITTSFTATGLVTRADLASQSANTVLGATSTGSPTALAVPSCSTSSSALIWTTGTGFGCNTVAGGGTITAGTTPTSGITSGDLISSSSNLVADSGSNIAAAMQFNTTYWYPYSACFVPPCSEGVNGLQSYTGSPNPVLIGPGSPQFLSYNVNGITDTVINPIAIGTSPSTIPSQTFTGKTFSLRFTSASITGSPVTVTYTGNASDNAQSTSIGLCNAVLANANLNNPTTGLPIVCDPSNGGGSFNLQWSVLVNPTVASVGTGTINLASPNNNLDGVFWIHNRRITGYSIVAGDTVACDIYNFNNVKLYQTCTQIESVSGGVPVVNVNFAVASGSNGDISAFQITGNGPIVPNSSTGVSLYFANSAGNADARMFENGSNGLLIYTGGAGNFVVANSSAVVLFDYGASVTGAFTFHSPFYNFAMPSSPSGNTYVCFNTTTGLFTAQSSC